jgi:hypothetical protein
MGFQCRRLKLRKVDVASARVRKQQWTLSPRPQLVERFERDRLQRDRASAQPGLGLLDPPVRVRPPDLYDTCCPVDVAVLEREQL